MRAVKSLTNNKFLNIKEVCDPDNHVRGYQYAERLGKDSVAFVCYDYTTNEILLNSEYKPPINEFILGAFGGSIDKDKNIKQIVIEEVREEAGFEVTEGDCLSMGRVFVSTQMNQFCYLFMVLVDRRKQKERSPENEVEAMAVTKWIDWNSDITDLSDWKAITIMSKYEKILNLL